jgi:hypothetical protein
MQGEIEIAQATVDDDLARDKMLQDLYISLADIQGKYGMTIDAAMIRAAQAATKPGAAR